MLFLIQTCFSWVRAFPLLPLLHLHWFRFGFFNFLRFLSFSDPVLGLTCAILIQTITTSFSQSHTIGKSQTGIDTKFCDQSVHEEGAPISAGSAPAVEFNFTHGNSNTFASEYSERSANKGGAPIAHGSTPTDRESNFNTTDVDHNTTRREARADWSG